MIFRPLKFWEMCREIIIKSKYKQKGSNNSLKRTIVMIHARNVLACIFAQVWKISRQLQFI